MRMSGGKEVCRVAACAGAVYRAGEPFGVAVGELVEYRGSGFGQVQPLGGRHGVVEGGEAGAPPPVQPGGGERT